MKKIALLAASVAAVVSGASAQVVNPSRLAKVKNELDRPFYAACLDSLRARADRFLTERPRSVMDKAAVPPSGDKHDYMSQARYFWPDTTKPGGLPYINRDGVSNPEIYLLDRYPMGEMADMVTTLSLAYYLTDDERYAAKATQMLRTWFLDKKTRMNPRLDYAQAVPGVDGGRGRCYGVLDTYSLVGMLDGVRLLEGSRSFTSRDAKALRRWFADMARWIATSPQGVEESRQANNHSTACDAQLMAFALYGGDRALARQVASDVARKRIFTQIEPDGSQPHELSRTLAYGYSQYNLSHMLDILQMARNAGLDTGPVVSPDGRSVEKGLDFLAPFTGPDAAPWPYQQISGMEEKQQECLRDLYRAALLNPDRTDFTDRYFAGRVLDYSDPFNLLYVEPRPVDDAMASAAPQLRYAVKCADAARRDEENARGRKVAPRSIAPDGSLTMVHPHDWCSGFFAGTLWQMYEYSRDPAWRRRAVSATWPVEEAKWHRGTHDLGFMIYDSFGQAYRLTGEASYRDVVLTSAQTLVTRFSESTGCIRSWDHNAEVWKYPVIIDNMMNLELLFRASQLTGDERFRDIAIRHADTTLANHFRPDGSCYHVVDYDPSSGAVRSRCTAQGYSDDSVWSRGQAWALYGFTQCYAYTGLSRYLDSARRTAAFIMSQPAMPDDLIPYWDMSDPRIADGRASECPRDASAAAITASALYMLADRVEEQEPAQASDYRRYADRILVSLTSAYRIPQGEKKGFLLDHSTGHHPAGSEIDVPLVYADYYYLEALLLQSRRH